MQYVVVRVVGNMANEDGIVTLSLELKSFVEATAFEPGETLDAEDNRHAAGRAAASVAWSVHRVLSG